jgi:hypothetical protein
LKNQYFGDVNDFRKYGLLRALAVFEGLRLGVCWMLTERDSRTDGNLMGYLANPIQYRHRDPALFDWLKQVVEVETDRRIARIESSTLLGPAVFQSTILTDRHSDRSKYFMDCRTLFSDRDLIFFDPDNGMEIRSRPRGRRHSCKHLYWDEVCETFFAGPSVLIYQHFVREKRSDYTARIVRDLSSRTGAAAVFSFSTPHVLFLLAAQGHHVNAFRRRLPVIEHEWKNHIAVCEHARGALTSNDGSKCNSPCRV